MSALPTPADVAQRRRAGAELLRQEDREAHRLYVLSTFSLDLFPPLLAEAMNRLGVPAGVELGAFGQLALELADPASALYRHEPDAVVLVPAPEDVLQPLFETPPSRIGPDEADAMVDERLAELGEQVTAMLDRLPGTTCYVVALGTDRVGSPSILDPCAADRRQTPLERFANGLRALSSSSPRIVVVDWDWHVRAYGWQAVRDDRLWYVGGMRLNPVGLAALGELVARNAAAYHGRAKKVVALDLDGTLWGGIVGEEGLRGLELGEAGLGLAFQDFQRELLNLHDAGVLLVVCSKNNPEDALEVFDRHPGMILRREHLAAERIDWRDKATNLRELAAELDLGLDSFVFLDDNPVERTWVSQALPEVLVPDLPADPVDRPRFLREASWFARTATTEADRKRAGSYREQRGRRELRRELTSFEDFLASLEQEIAIEPVHEGTLARAAQLCQRTNQFNLTTHRYAVADIERLAAAEDSDVLTLAVRDRFGDSGVTGLAVLRYHDDETEIDTFLMSCRVLGRRVEDAFLATLAERAVARGSRTLTGTYEPTAKNAQVATFYPERGFVEAGERRYRLDLTEGAPVPPPQIRITVTAHA
jgi:FkbH-like protein